MGPHQMTNNTTNTGVPDAQWNKALREALDQNAISGPVVFFLKSKYGKLVPITAKKVTYGLLKGMLEVVPLKDSGVATLIQEVPRIHAMSNKKRSTKEAEIEVQRKQFEVQRRKLEEEHQHRENQLNRTVDAENSDSDSDASEARTEQSHSTSGLSGYTEDLEGFRAPSSGVSYVPSEARESVASRRAPIGLRSRTVEHVSLPEALPSFAYTGPAPPPPAVVLQSSGASSESSWSSSSASSGACSSSASSGSSSASSGSSSASSSVGRAVGRAALQVGTTAALQVGPAAAIQAVRSAAGV